MILFLDTMVLWTLCHPSGSERVQEVREVMDAQISSGTRLAVAAISDYEARRELLRKGAMKQLARLDRLVDRSLFVPFDGDAMKRAAQMWAERRNTGQATGHPEALDGDVILAAHAERHDDAVVVTENLRHFSGLCRAVDWRKLRRPNGS